MTLLASDHSVRIKCRICWRMICAKNERSMQKRYCHSCMLPSMMAGIIIWPVISCDFSWIDHHVACGLCRKGVVTKPRLDIQSRKFMFTIMWNPSGFYIVDRLPNDTKMNNDYFVINIFIPSEQVIFPRGRAPHQKRLMVHLDNCSVHTSRVSRDWLEEHDMRRMSDLPYSRDLVPVTSTCFL
jgi:hypothetical protein